MPGKEQVVNADCMVLHGLWEAEASQSLNQPNKVEWLA